MERGLAPNQIKAYQNLREKQLTGTFQDKINGYGDIMECLQLEWTQSNNLKVGCQSGDYRAQLRQSSYAIQSLLFFVKVNKQLTHQMLRQNNGWKFLTFGLNIYRQLVVFLKIHQTLRNNTTKDIILKNLCKLLVIDELNWFRIHQTLIKQFYEMWLIKPLYNENEKKLKQLMESKFEGNINNIEDFKKKQMLESTKVIIGICIGVIVIIAIVLVVVQK